MFITVNCFKLHTSLPGLSAGIPNLLKADSSQVSFQGKIFSNLFSGGGDLKTWLLALLGLKVCTLQGLISDVRQAFRTAGSKETLVVLLAAWFSIQHMRLHTPKWWGRSRYMDRRLNSVIMEMPGNNIIMQPIDQTRSCISTAAKKLRISNNKNISFLFSFGQKVELVGEGSVINGGYPV